MAMGTYHGKGNNGGGYREKGCPYGAMLLLAFAAALVGVMGLHKLRERRIHNLVLRDKDRELFSLHLLLQKEKEYAKEMTEKAEEMRVKMYSLRTQKMELDSRILEMQSTISSLKEEQRTMELALEEKRDEIKLLHEKEMDMGKRGLKESSLKEILKQKETEIEDLKRQLESLNLSTRESETKKEEMKKLEEKEERGELHESSENSTADKELEETWRKVGISEGTMLAEKEKLQDQGNVTEGSVQGEAAGERDGFEAFGMNKGDSVGSQNKQNSVDKGETNGLNANSTANFAAGEVMGVNEGKAEVKKLEERLKPEQSGNSSGYSGSTVPRKLSDGKGGRRRGKRWRALARSRMLEKNRNSATMKHRRFIENAIEIIEGKQVGDNAANRQDQGMNMKKANKPDQVGSLEKVSRDLNGDNQERKEDGHGFESRGEGEISKEGKEQEQMSNLDQSNYGGVPTMGNLESGPGVPVNDGENRAPEVGIGGVGSRGGDATEDKINKDKDSGEAGASEEEVPDYPEEEARETDVKDSRESEMERAGDDFFKGGNVEEPREEATDESEF